MKKRILALIMSMLLIACTLLTLASCKDDGDGDGDQSDVDIPWMDDLGDHDLGGYKVKFAVAEAAEDDGFNERSIVASNNTGDRVDQKIYNRNKNIQNRFNCNISIEFVDNDNLADTTVKDVLIGEGSEYDVLAARQYDDVVLCSQGLVLDIRESETASKYIDISKPYWAKNYIKGMTYNNQYYWLTGDLNLRYTGGFYATFVNATIYNQSLRDTFGDIHDIVNNKQWTVDKLQEMSDAVARISEGSKPGALVDGDVVGVAFPIHDNTNGLAVSSGVQFSKLNKDGSISFTFTTTNSRLKTFYSEYMELINSKGCMNYYDANKNGGYVTAFDDFASDKALFVFGRINQAELYLRNTKEGAFYIVPNPMLNESQDGYVSSLHDAISIYGINPHSENIKASAIVLEAMAGESYRSVRPEYYDKALGNKYTRDENTKAMINLISENSYSDFALVWAFTTYFSGSDGGLGNFLRSNMRRGEADLSTSLSAQGRKWSLTAMEDIAEAFAKIKS